jgi:hypothetical protein
MPLPTPPGPRIAYDQDGTLVFARSTTSAAYKGGVVQGDPRAVQALNSVFDPPAIMGDRYFSAQADADAWLYWDYPTPTPYLIFLFPVQMQMQGILFCHTATPTLRWTVETSTNTTNGIDGDWVKVGSFTNGTWSAALARDDPDYYVSYQFTSGVPYTRQAYARYSLGMYYRQTASANDGKGIAAMSGMGTRNVAGLRMYPGEVPDSGNFDVSGPMTVLLYGTPESSSHPDYLALWQTDLDLPVAAGYLDFGDVPAGSSSDKSFRIKNLSAERTANGITLSAHREEKQPTPASDILFSTDLGQTWSSTVEVGSISPENISTRVLVRRVTNKATVLGPDEVRVDVTVGKWTP